MKFLKVLSLCLLFLCLFMQPAKAQVKPGGYAIMRVFDCNKGIGMGGGYLQSKILIVYADSTTEEIELLPFNEKNELENLKKIAATLNSIKDKGYLLISQTLTGEQGSLVQDYTFMKLE